jgi:hypothetical protein
MKYGGFALVGLALLFGACGDDGGEQAAFDAAPIPVDAEVITACTSAGGTGGTHKLFLNFESQELTAGAVNDATQNTTTIVSATVTSPPWFDGAATRDDLITLVVDNVTALLAPFDIEVVTTRPAAGPYTMMVLGGSPADLGLPGSSFSVATATCIANVENQVHVITDFGYRPTVQTIIAAYALGEGFGASKTNGACLCWNNAACDPRPDGICTLSADDEIEIDEAISCDAVTTVTMNAHQKFKQRFGCRP